MPGLEALEKFINHDAFSGWLGKLPDLFSQEIGKQQKSLEYHEKTELTENNLGDGRIFKVVKVENSLSEVIKGDPAISKSYWMKDMIVYTVLEELAKAGHIEGYTDKYIAC